MHNWEDLRPLVVFCLHGLKVGEQIRDVWAGAHGGRFCGGEDGVEFTVREHLREVLAGLDRRDFDVWR